MDKEIRAAQFAPFAALTGFDDDVAEAERHTESRRVLFDDDVFAIEQSLENIAHSRGGVLVEVVYFVPDAVKSGGAYKTKSGVVRRIDEVMRTLVFEDRKVISVDDIVEINEIA